MLMDIRTTAPVKPEAPYDWNSKNKGQCTWGAYYRTKEAFGIAPCYWDGPTKVGTFTDAKLWPENLHEGFVKKPTSYNPKAGDIGVFDGKAGHVIFIEKIKDDKNCLISHWNKDSDGVYHSEVWQKGSIIKGKKVNTGNLKNYIHYVAPVERNENINQVKVNTNSQNLRDNPEGNVIGNCLNGYFNVSKVYEGKDFVWYCIDDDVWIAGVKGRIEFLPKKEIKDDYKKLYEESQKKLEKSKQLAKEIIEL